MRSTWSIEGSFKTRRIARIEELWSYFLIFLFSHQNERTSFQRGVKNLKLVKIENYALYTIAIAISIWCLDAFKFDGYYYRRTSKKKSRDITNNIFIDSIAHIKWLYFENTYTWSTFFTTIKYPRTIFVARQWKNF